MSHQFAPVAPLPILRGMDEAKLLGHYQLLIAPIVLTNPEPYKAFFQDREDQLIILDNGVIEQGYPLDPVELWAAVKFVSADVLVLPDTIDDGAYTAKQVAHALDGFYRMGAMRRRSPRTDKPLCLMGVVQGTTLEECLACAKSHVEAGVDWLAVPRGLTPNLGSRVQLTVTLAEAYELPIHILGFSDNVADDIMAATCHDLVRGIDAATPTWMGAATPYGAPTRLPLHPPDDLMISQSWGRRPEGFWWLDRESVDSNVVGANWETVRRWLRDAKNVRISKAELADRMDLETPHS